MVSTEKTKVCLKYHLGILFYSAEHIYLTLRGCSQLNHIWHTTLGLQTTQYEISWWVAVYFGSNSGIKKSIGSVSVKWLFSVFSSETAFSMLGVVVLTAAFPSIPLWHKQLLCHKCLKLDVGITKWGRGKSEQYVHALIVWINNLAARWQKILLPKTLHITVVSLTSVALCFVLSERLS